MTTRYTHMRPRPEVNASVPVPLDVKLMHMAASLMFVGLAWVRCCAVCGPWCSCQHLRCEASRCMAMSSTTTK